MSSEQVEIERRFRILDPFGLPPLGAPARILQCYLPKWRIGVVEDRLVFEENTLVSGLSRDAVQGIQQLIEGGKLTPRIRLKNEMAFVTVKGPGDLSREEWEFEVPSTEVRELVESWRFPSVLKRRHTVDAGGGLFWEIDFFEGENAGLVLAEIELPSPDHTFARPDWLGPEVTMDGRFGNGALAREPWCDIRDEV